MQLLNRISKKYITNKYNEITKQRRIPKIRKCLILQI